MSRVMSRIRKKKTLLLNSMLKTQEDDAYGISANLEHQESAASSISACNRPKRKQFQGPSGKFTRNSLNFSKKKPQIIIKDRKCLRRVYLDSKPAIMHKRSGTYQKLVDITTNFADNSASTKSRTSLSKLKEVPSFSELPLIENSDEDTAIRKSLHWDTSASAISLEYHSCECTDAGSTCGKY